MKILYIDWFCLSLTSFTRILTGDCYYTEKKYCQIITSAKLMSYFGEHSSGFKKNEESCFKIWLLYDTRPV